MCLYTISDFGKYLPYPYYRMAEDGGEEPFMTYLDDEIGHILKLLENNSKSDQTVICLFEIPTLREGLHSKNFRIPLLICSSDFDSDRQVKNDYSALDIVPTVLDAAGAYVSGADYQGISFFDPEFVKQDIILTDVSALSLKNDMFSKNDEGYVSKNVSLEREVYPYLKRSLIRGDYKLDAVPGAEGLRYRLFDISKDPDEQNDLVNINPQLAKKMIGIYEDKMNKEFNFKIVNGFVLK